MKTIPRSIQQLIRQFNTLPGIGSKTSERFVYFLLKQPKENYYEIIREHIINKTFNKLLKELAKSIIIKFII